MEGLHSRPYLKWTALAAVALALLAVILLFTLDLGFLRGTVEERVRQSTGRTFAINGPLSIRLGRELRLSATDVELGNPAWAGEDRMLRIGQLDARLDTLSLFTGPLLFNDLRIEDLALSLVQAQDGRANWELAEPGEPQAGGLGLVLTQMNISNADIGLVSPRLDRPMRLHIELFSQQLAADGYLESTFRAEVNGSPVAFEGRAGPYSDLASGEGIGIEGAGSLGRTEIRGSARFDNLWSPARPVFDLKVSGPELAELTDILGIEGLGSGPLDLQASASPVAEELELSISGRLGELTTQATATVPSLADTSNSRLSARLSGPNFGRLARLAGFEGWPESAFELDTDLRRPGQALEIDRLEVSMADARLSLSGRLPGFPGLAGSELSLAASGSDLAPFRVALGMPEMPQGAFSVDGTVSTPDDQTTRLALNYAIPVARGEISGTLGGGEELLGTALNIRAEGADAAALGRSFGLPGLPAAPWSMTGNFAASADGWELSGVEGKLASSAFSFDGQLGPAETSTGRFALEASGPDISSLLPELAGLTLNEGDFEIRVKGDWEPGRVRVEDGDLRMGASRLLVKGLLDLPPDLSGTRLEVDLHAPQLSRLGMLDGARWAAVPFRLQSSFSGTATRLRMEPFRAQLGDSVVSGTLDIDFEGELPYFDLAFASDAFDFRPFQADENVDAGDGEAANPDARLIPELDFPMAALSAANGRFSVQTKRLLLKDGNFHNIVLAGEVRDGSLLVSELGADGFKGRLVMDLALKPAGSGARLATHIRTQGFIYDHRELSAEHKTASPPFDANIAVGGQGSSLREAAASLQGNIRIQSPGGQLRNNKRLSNTRQVLAEVLSAISPSAASRDVLEIACFAAVISAKAGRLKLDPGIVLQSDKFTLFAGGDVNLDTEKLDISLTAETHSSTDISASELFSPYVKLGGTLADPSVEMDTMGTLLSGGVAYLSGGLSILAKKALDQISGARDPCAEYLKQAQGDTPP